MSILKVWQLTLILAKQDPVEGGHIEKRLFTLFWWENMISDLSIDFQMVTNGGFKKASLYVHYEGLTTDSYFGKTRLTGERSYRKMGIFTLFWWENMISDLSIDFQMVTKWGVKKASLYVHYEGLIPDSYFGKERLPGERSYRKRLFYTLLMRKHDFWPFHWFSNGQKWGVLKASLHVHYEGLTTDSYSAKQDPLGRGHIEKRDFYTLLMRKHDFWPFQWLLNGQKWGGFKKLLSMSIMKVWQLTLILAKQDPVEGGHIEKWAFVHSSVEKTWFLTFPLIFKWSPMGGLKKLLSMSILKVWQLTLILAKQDSMGRGYTEKKAFLHSSDEKAWFLTFPLIFKWSKMGSFKSFSLCLFWRFDN